MNNANQQPNVFVSNYISKSMFIDTYKGNIK